MSNCSHTFAEEREPGGRLILTPCLSCGMTAMDAMEAAKAEVKRLRGMCREMYDIARLLIGRGEHGYPHNSETCLQCQYIERLARTKYNFDKAEGRGDGTK